MKNEVIKELSTGEIVEKIEELRKQLTTLRLNHTVSDLENPLVIRATKKNIARLMTELSVRENQTATEKN